ncbi:DnaK suppressor protein [Pseudomonas cavernicola]|uniref:DnaK suppressor protein n=1 Tax=Pseudomonas cavernicola TaxID=2320866 RepID=A0A418XEJ1_9PSED|nr:TraR/DksA C4-type zinc finger protein [Pseudomonas cavernicola]RJG10941.1 DnaK suppressor protein [Pseudomonas cavernicola]
MADDADVTQDCIEVELSNALAARVQYTGIAATECQDCGDAIPPARREAVKGTQHCTPCAELLALRAGGVRRG